MEHVKRQTGQHSGSLGTLPSRTDSKLTFSQAACRSSSRAGPVSRPLNSASITQAAVLEEIKSVDVAAEMLKACVNTQGWTEDVRYNKVIK